MEQLHQALAEIKTMAAEGLLDGAEALEMRREVIAAHREEIRRRSDEGRAELEAKRAITAMTVAMGHAVAQATQSGLILPPGFSAPAPAVVRARRAHFAEIGVWALKLVAPILSSVLLGSCMLLSSSSHSRRLLSQRSTMVRRMCSAPAPFHRMPTCRGPTHSLASRRLRRTPRS